MFPVTIAPAWSLGEFRPQLRLFDHVERRLIRFIEERVSIYERQRVEVRSPDYDWRRPATPEQQWMHATEKYRTAGNIQLWHRDGCGVGKQFYLATWSNKVSTEFVIGEPFDWSDTAHEGPPRSKIYQAEPGEVVLFDNCRFYHRQPMVDSRKDYEGRWWARFHVPYFAEVDGTALTFPQGMGVDDLIPFWLDGKRLYPLDSDDWD